VTVPVPTYVCVSSIIIDDIVYPDGRTDMEVLGGGGVHTAAGMVVWGERPGLVSTKGNGLPQSAAARLESYFDMRGVVTLDIPQVRAWQLFEWNGKRTEIFRVDEIEPFLSEPRPAALTPDYREAKAVGILRNSHEFMEWRQAFPEAMIFWEPEQTYMVADNRDELRRTLPYADIVSPNVLEACQVYGTNDPNQLLDHLLSDGAKIVALRLGEAGSMVATANERISIPAVPVPKVVDQTGAGNTYCGAFLVGWHRTSDLRTAGYYGAVAASFALETVGILDPPSHEQRDERYQWLVQQG
jgi:sugar/nucleoside kinase (ribokinase family)